MTSYVAWMAAALNVGWSRWNSAIWNGIPTDFKGYMAVKESLNERGIWG